MTLRHAGIVALTFLLGCARFGYDAPHVPIDPIPDARRDDGGTAHENDAAVAVADAESRQDASAFDGSALDASAPDTANPDSGAGPSDAALDDDDAGAQDDAAMQGSMDGGAMDGGSSDLGPCAFTVTNNTYLGSPNFHGWLSLQNAGATTWTTPTIRFDLPSSVYVCDDPNILPGAGWALQSSGGHCTYTKTAPSMLSIAPGATLDFEYSSDNDTAPSDPAATSVSVSGCP